MTHSSILPAMLRSKDLQRSACIHVDMVYAHVVYACACLHMMCVSTRQLYQFRSLFTARDPSSEYIHIGTHCEHSVPYATVVTHLQRAGELNRCFVGRADYSSTWHWEVPGYCSCSTH